jgi:hypothetical protein
MCQGHSGLFRMSLARYTSITSGASTAMSRQLHFCTTQASILCLLSGATMNRTVRIASLYVGVFSIAYGGFFYQQYTSRQTPPESSPALQQPAVNTASTIPAVKAPEAKAPNNSAAKNPVIPVARPRADLTARTDVKSVPIQQSQIRAITQPQIKIPGMSMTAPNSPERLPELPEHPETLPSVESLIAGGLGAGIDAEAVTQNNPEPQRPAIESIRKPVRTRKSNVYFQHGHRDDRL